VDLLEKAGPKINIKGTEGAKKRTSEESGTRQNGWKQGNPQKELVGACRGGTGGKQKKKLSVGGAGKGG